MSPGALENERISRRFWFAHESGARLYPYRLKDQATGRVAFRVAPGATGANKVKNQTQLDSEDDVFRHVFGKGWSVRMRSLDGLVEGLYSKDGHSITRTSESSSSGRNLTASDYRAALISVDASEKGRAFLAAHYYAPGHKASMEALAYAVGYDSHNAANVQYGQLAHAIADALPRPPRDVPDGRYGNWMQSVAWADGENDAAGHFLWTLRPEMADALEALGWISSDGRSAEEGSGDPSASQIGGTTRQALIDARRGQGLFRRYVLQYWGGRCAVTGCAAARVLLASHIKPWSGSTNIERMDGFNGLLLTPNLDRLFDNHLIAFEDDGRMLVAPSLSGRDRRALGIDPTYCINRLHSRHKPYLAAHRERFRSLGTNTIT